MARYKMTGKSPCRTYQGFKAETLDNGRVVARIVQVEFGKDGIAEVDDDVDMSASVASRFISVVEAAAPVKAKAEPKPAPKVEPEATPPAPPVEPEEEPKTAPPVEPDDDVEDEDEEEAGDYEELSDGSFKCLLCDIEGEEKILKTEKGMINHIESAH